MAAFGSAIPALQGLGLDSLDHVCQPAHLWSRSLAYPDVSRSTQFILVRIFVNQFAFNAGPVCAIHVRTSLCAGESAHDQAGSIETVVGRWSLVVRMLLPITNDLCFKCR